VIPLMHIMLSVFLNSSLCFLLIGCQSWQERSFWGEGDGIDDLRTYENDYGSRIEQYLELAEDGLINSYKRNQYQMILGDSPIAVVHPRKDMHLRELILSAHEEGKLTDHEKKRFLSECDELYELWESHWRSADLKARRLGVDR